MNLSPSERPSSSIFSGSPTMFCTIFSIVAIGLGLLVMFGWQAHVTELVQVFPGLVPMQFNTALGFALLGSALLFSCRKHRTGGKVLGIMSGLLGLLTLLQYLTQTNFGIDELLFDHYLTTKTTHPGRMAPKTALCFFLGGTALFFANVYKRWSLVFPLGTIVAGLGSLAFLGYMTDMETSYGWGHLTRMAIHTSIAFIILGFGIAIWGLSLLEGSTALQQHWKVLVVAISLMVIALSQWQILKGKEEKEIQNEVAIHLSSYIEDLELKNENHFSALQRLAKRLDNKKQVPLDLLEADARLLFKDLDGLAAVGYLDPSQKSYWIADMLEEPLIGDPYSKGHGFLSQDILTSLPHAHTYVARAVTYQDGSHDVLTSTPILFNDTYNGLILSIHNLEDMLTKQIGKTAFENFEMRVFDGPQLLLGKEGPINFAEKGYVATKTLSLKNMKLKITFSPTQRFLKDVRSWLPNLILLSGLISITALAFLFILRKQNLKQLVLLNEEIKKRTSTERSLQSSNTKLQLILDSAQEGILGVDMLGRIVFANNMAEALLKYPSGDLKGCEIKSLFSKEQASDEAPSFEFEDHITQPKEAVLQRSDGTTFPIQFAKSATQDPHGVAKGTVITFQDISERKKYEQAILRHASELERSNKALDEFAYIASHDLKAPLRGIMQLSKWIKDDVYDQLSDKTKEFFGLLENRVARMERLLSDLLDYARVGNKHGNFKEVDVANLVKELFDFMAPTNGFRLHCSDTLPTLTTLSVPLEQVFRNLINNAIKHHDREEGLITISATPGPGGGYEFCVADDGPGIPPRHHERIFQIFQTLKPKDVVEGSGMGLPLVQKIIESYAGVISIHSDGSRGTKICFTWPSEETLRNIVHA